MKFSLLLLEIMCSFSLCINIAYSAMSLNGQMIRDDDIGILMASSVIPKTVVLLFFILLYVLVLMTLLLRKNYLVFKEM